jgi:cathepsin B
MTCCTSCGQGCNGGYLGPTWSYYQVTGVVTGDLYGDKTTCRPYSLPPCAHHTTSAKYPACPQPVPTPNCTRKCQDGYATAYNADKHYGKNSYSVTGVTNMMNDISTNGPIEVAFSVYEDFLTYKTGIYSHTTGQFLGGHAVKALGYGTDNGVAYWLIANSWNETWGDNGYFKIKKGTNECGIEGQGVAGLAKI